jgi:hypothetical protein
MPAVTVIDQDLPYITALQSGFTETPENRCESGKLTTPRSTCEQLRTAWITIAGRFGKPPPQSVNAKSNCVPPAWQAEMPVPREIRTQPLQLGLSRIPAEMLVLRWPLKHGVNSIVGC